MPGKHPNPPAEPAKQQGDRLLLTPELSLCSYPPEDLLLRDGFCQAYAQRTGPQNISGIVVVVGHPHELYVKHCNAESLLRDGRVVATYLKYSLPNCAVFDAERYFDHGTGPMCLKWTEYASH